MMVRGIRICCFNSCWVWPELEMTPGSLQKLLGPGDLLFKLRNFILILIPPFALEYLPRSSQDLFFYSIC